MQEQHTDTAHQEPLTPSEKICCKDAKRILSLIAIPALNLMVVRHAMELYLATELLPISASASRHHRHAPTLTSGSRASQTQEQGGGSCQSSWDEGTIQPTLNGHLVIRIKMSGRLVSSRLAPFARRPFPDVSRRLAHQSSSAAGGLLRSDVVVRTGRRRAWPLGSYSMHNVPAVRTISFARVLPKLVLKFARIPAMFGGAMIAGLAYLQYQATRKCRTMDY